VLGLSPPGHGSGGQGAVPGKRGHKDTASATPHGEGARTEEPPWSSAAELKAWGDGSGVGIL